MSYQTTLNHHHDSIIPFCYKIRFYCFFLNLEVMNKRKGRQHAAKGKGWTVAFATQGR